MPRDFGPAVFEPVEASRDRELTLGPATLAVLALLLCSVCAVCFVWGYSVGHRRVADPADQQASASAPSSQQSSGQAKPNASQSSAIPQTAAQDDAPPADSAPATDDSVSPSGSAPVAAPSTAASSNAPSVVQAALPGQQPASASAAASGRVQSALGQWSVQIAAVSHQEDADVLVSALRKRGYAVSARRDPADNLIHVQVGPFASHADAASMRERLLGDGYNALIEP